MAENSLSGIFLHILFYFITFTLAEASLLRLKFVPNAAYILTTKTTVLANSVCYNKIPQTE